MYIDELLELQLLHHLEVKKLGLQLFWFGCGKMALEKCKYLWIKWIFQNVTPFIKL